MMIDSHAHLDDVKFDGDRDIVIEDLFASGVQMVINPGADPVSSKNAVELAGVHEFIFAAVGTHPHDAEGFVDEDIKLYKALAENPKVVAIGEIGLDYHYDNSPRDVQKAVFIRQMELAEELGLPVIIHSRDAHADTFEILNRFKGRVFGVMHCYSGSCQMATEYLKLGYYLSLAGPVTYKNAAVPKEVAAHIPADKLLIETDSPYLSPEPKRGRRNDPRNLIHIAREIARIRNTSLEELIKLTSENTKRLFSLEN